MPSVYHSATPARQQSIPQIAALANQNPPSGTQSSGLPIGYDFGLRTLIAAASSVFLMWAA